MSLCQIELKNICLRIPSTPFRTQSMLFKDFAVTAQPFQCTWTKADWLFVPGAVLCTSSTAVLLFVIGGRAWGWKIESVVACFSPDQICMISALTSITAHCRSPLSRAGETPPRFKRTISRPEGEKLSGRRCNYARIITSRQFISENMRIRHKCLGTVCISRTSNY